MKEQVIETAGKTWRFLGQNGETNVSQLGKAMKEKDQVVYQALGWLAREDKINYTIKNRRTFVSLVESELRAFNSLMYNITEQIQAAQTTAAHGSGNGNGNGKFKRITKTA